MSSVKGIEPSAVRLRAQRLAAKISVTAKLQYFCKTKIKFCKREINFAKSKNKLLGIKINFAKGK